MISERKQTEKGIIMDIIQTEDLKKYYKTSSGEVRALDGVSIRIEEGEFVSIVGASGSGKTTLLNLLGGLDTPTQGQVHIRGNRLSSFGTEELTIFRRRNIGFVFQMYNLLPTLNVWENITLPLRLDGKRIDGHDDPYPGYRTWFRQVNAEYESDG